MTTEEKREYMREYRAKNKDKIKKAIKDKARKNFIKSIRGDKNAVFEWLKYHTPGRGWIPVEGHYSNAGIPVVILWNQESPFPYSVQKSGNGTYFCTLEEASEWLNTKLKAT